MWLILTFLSFCGMLRLRALLRYLDRVRTGGVKCIMLFSSEGVLLTHSGVDSGNAKTTAAIVSNIWNLYQKQLQFNETVTQHFLLQTTWFIFELMRS